MPPVRAGADDAPMIATAAGRNIGSSEATSMWSECGDWDIPLTPSRTPQRGSNEERERRGDAANNPRRHPDEVAPGSPSRLRDGVPRLRATISKDGHKHRACFH